MRETFNAFSKKEIPGRSSKVPAPLPLQLLDDVGPLDGILCDIDDTLTWHGRLIPEALQGLQRAQAAGLKVIPVTGRPAGWVDQIARLWPVDGVVGENGGLWFWMDDAGLQRGFIQDLETRRTNRERLNRLQQQILADVPGSALASDQAYRELDLAIDFCEDVAPLSRELIDRIITTFQQAGATCKESSIHINGWFGHFDKLAGFRNLHQALWGTPPDPNRWAYFGDSANDSPMFGFFPLSIGVANVAEFLDRMPHGPAWITPSPGGYGFVEGLDRILSLRTNG